MALLKIYKKCSLWLDSMSAHNMDGGWGCSRRQGPPSDGSLQVILMKLQLLKFLKKEKELSENFEPHSLLM